MSGRFSETLNLVLKTLSISRGRLASDLAVDKSIVSRWCSGANAPSGENLSGLTAWTAARVPGFTGLHWDRDAAEIAGLFSGAEAAPDMAAALGFWLGHAGMNQALARTAKATEDCEGIWRTTRPVPNVADWFIREYVLIQRAPHGLMRFRAGSLNLRLEGWSYVVGNQLFSSAVSDGGQSMFGIYHRPLTGRATVLDGVIVWPQTDAGGAIYASAAVLSRVEDLAGDADADEARFEGLMAEPPVVAKHAVPAELQRYLTERADARSVLSMPYIGSLAYRARVEEDAKVVEIRRSA